MKASEMIKRSAVVVLAALLGLLVLQSTALAHHRTFPTHVSLDYAAPNFVGTVSSSNSACVSSREVVLYERQRGGGSLPVGSATTDASGNFSIAQPGADGRYYVTVSARNLSGGYSHSHTCDGARSSTTPAGSGVLGGRQATDGNGGVAGTGTGAGSGLPFTGVAIGGFVVTGLALIGLGTVLARRRRSSLPSS